MPDLVINKPRLVGSIELQKITFSAAECAVVEGCVPEGVRKLLKFDVGFQNVGDGDLIIGDPNARPDLFESSVCHGHFHLAGVANYELLDASGASVLRARKQGWCFRDNEPFSASAGPAKYTCDNQGITAGWEDIYDKSLDCQFLDVSGVPGGQYRLRVVVNPDGVFQEANYANNATTVSITLPGAPQAVAPPPVTNPQPPQAQPAKNAWKKLKEKFKQQKAKKKAKKKKKAKHKPQPAPKPPGSDDDDGRSGHGDD